MSGARAFSSPRLRPPLRALLAASLLGLLGAPAAAQQDPERPGASWPALPELEHGLAPVAVLPPLSLPEPRHAATASRAAVWAGERVPIAGIRVIGNTVLSEAAVREATAPYASGEISFAEPQRLRDELTLLYVARGYVTSGALLSPQLSADGFAEFRMVEGTLREVRISGARRFRQTVLRERVAPRSGAIVNVQALEARLRALQEDPRIARIDAQLVPGPALGQADLDLSVQEGSPYRFSVLLDNHESPAVGGTVARSELSHLNLTGRGDALQASYALTDGSRQYSARYELPLGRFGTSVAVRHAASRSEVVEKPFADLDIESRSATYALDVRQPLAAREGLQLDLLASAEHRRSKSYLFGSRFSFSSDSERGETRLAVLQLGPELILRAPERVIAARSLLRWGVDVLGSTRGSGSGSVDGRFLSWLTQAQWAQRLPFADATLLARANLQLSTDALPGMEQFAIGGHGSVRGYRENRLVRDQGWNGSLELRIPLWRRPNSDPFLELVPFADFGSSWSRGRESPGPRTLASVGAGLLFRIRENVFGEIYYAHALRDLSAAESRKTIQDRGLHFRVGTLFP
jgi:hemolysin activation/secretion protein